MAKYDLWRILVRLAREGAVCSFPGLLPKNNTDIRKVQPRVSFVIGDGRSFPSAEVITCTVKGEKSGNDKQNGKVTDELRAFGLGIWRSREKGENDENSILRKINKCW